MKNKRTNGGRQYDLSNASASSDPYDALVHPMRNETKSAGVRACAEVMSC